MQGARGGGVRQIVTIDDKGGRWTWIFAVSRKLFFPKARTIEEQWNARG